MGDTICVPVNLDALVVNKDVLMRDSFRWWDYNYESLNRFISPQPIAMDASKIVQEEGVYLHWTLPRSLRCSDDGGTNYPLIPNRWLVVRVVYGGHPTVSAWVVESDCPSSKWTSGLSTSAMPCMVTPEIQTLLKGSADPYRNQADFNNAGPGSPVTTVNLGVAFPLDGWSERDAKTVFLTALAAGNVAFSSYVPHNLNILSFHDSLQGIDQGRLSYYAVGWYSDGDPLFQGGTRDVLNTLDKMDWVLRQQPSGPIDRSLYCGSACNILWDRNGEAPVDDPLMEIQQTQKLNVAVGNSLTDAFAALARKKLYWSGNQAVDADRITRLLTAFSQDMLLELSKTNGDVLLDEKKRQTWFGAKQGGTRWRYADENNPDKKPVQRTPQELEALAELNRRQRKLDRLIQELHASQQELWFAWWKQEFLKTLLPFLNRTKRKPEDFAPFFNTEDQTSLLSRVLSLLDEIKHRQKEVEACITDGMRQEREARYWKPANPVVLISGLNPPKETDHNTSLVVRLLDKATVNPSPLPATDALPNGVAAAVAGLYRNDPASPGRVREPDGTALAVQWRQPFEPLFMEWRACYVHIPMEENGRANWDFDAADYKLRLDVQPEHCQSVSVGGISMLSPHLRQVFGGRLNDLSTSLHGDMTPEVSEWLQTVENWRFLAQELTGFHEMLAQRDVRPFRRPSDEGFVYVGKTVRFTDVMGFPHPNAEDPAFATPAHAQGAVDCAPFIRSSGKTPFFGMRSGQMYFTDLILYDKFGRVLNLILSNEGAATWFAGNFPLICSDAMRSGKKIGTAGAVQVALPPRMLQYARLNIEYIDHRDPRKLLGLASDVNPVCGFLVSNHINRSAALFAPDGQNWGELLVMQSQAGKRVRWVAPPYGDPLTLDDIQGKSPVMAVLISTLTGQGTEIFHAFIDLVDKTLWTIEQNEAAYENRNAFLTGRPLALIQTRVSLELEGKAVCDLSWDQGFEPVVPEFTNYKFMLRLGGRGNRNDGLVGCFVNMDYNVFHCVADVPGNDWVRQIGAGNYIPLTPGSEEPVVVTMLADPTAAVHAYTGILPVKETRVPDSFIRDALGLIDPAFHFGPILLPSNDVMVKLPSLESNRGEAVWWEKEIHEVSAGYVESFRSFRTQEATDMESRTEPSPSIREGILYLSQRKEKP